MKQREEGIVDSTPKKSKGKASRGASKKAYYAKGPSQRAKNLLAASKRVARRKAYWASVVGQARKAAKMSTPEKIEKMQKWRAARAIRRSTTTS